MSEYTITYYSCVRILHHVYYICNGITIRVEYPNVWSTHLCVEISRVMIYINSGTEIIIFLLFKN